MTYTRKEYKMRYYYVNMYGMILPLLVPNIFIMTIVIFIFFSYRLIREQKQIYNTDRFDANFFHLHPRNLNIDSTHTNKHLLIDHKSVYPKLFYFFNFISSYLP